MINGYFIGLMSGTSADGIDVSIARTDGDKSFEPINALEIEFSKELKQLILSCYKDFNYFPELEYEFTKANILAVKKILEISNIKPQDVRAIGFHGQTICHKPELKFSWQIGNSALLAHETKINVVGNFRARDIAYGGNGAPLLPIFHKYMLGREDDAAIINIGGVSNLTYVGSNLTSELIAFDCGPGCAIIDDLMNKYYSKNYDQDGQIALSGTVDLPIIIQIMQDTYFKKTYPKSLDRNYFSKYYQLFDNLSSNNAISTASYLTAYSIFIALKMLPSLPKNIYICGGGALNKAILSYLKEIFIAEKLEIKINLVNKLNFDERFVETFGFAYLAARNLNKLPSSFKHTTGALKPAICGDLFNC